MNSGLEWKLNLVHYCLLNEFGKFDYRLPMFQYSKWVSNTYMVSVFILHKRKTTWVWTVIKWSGFFVKLSYDFSLGIIFNVQNCHLRHFVNFCKPKIWYELFFSLLFSYYIIFCCFMRSRQNDSLLKQISWIWNNELRNRSSLWFQ